MVLRNNGIDNLTLSANGLFTFPTPLVTDTAYVVTVSNQPVGQTCAVTRGSGTISTANVTTVSIRMALPPTANFLFKSNFGQGVSLGVPRLNKIGHGAWQDIVGKDTETGYSWPVAAVSAYFSGLQLIT